MTHGFDDQGRKFDGHGPPARLVDGRGRQAVRGPGRRASARSIDAYEPLPGAHINGELTMGENIADLGGLTLALDAYHASPARQARAGDRRPDRRPARLPRLGAGLARARSATTPCASSCVTDPHSPGRFRVNGVVRNIDAWYAAFDVKPGDKLYLAPADRAKVW